MTQSKLKTSYLIHIFALLHGLIAVATFYIGVNGNMMLTFLTVSLIILICLRDHVPVDFIAISIIIANVVGYLLGTYGSAFMRRMIHLVPLSGVITTVFTTEFLGWSTHLFARYLGYRVDTTEEKRIKIKWFILIAVTILLFRMLYVLLFDHLGLDDLNVLKMLQLIFHNPFPLICCLGINLIYLNWKFNRKPELSYSVRISLTLLFLSVITYLTSLLYQSMLPVGYYLLDGFQFKHIIVISSIMVITSYALVYALYYTYFNKIEKEKEKEKANLAKYRYIKLKEQVNPHFLFNSLNILDCLVKENQNEQASVYIHKLAGVYRYMIRNENEETVPLQEELTYVDLYLELLRVRFPSGFEISYEVSGNVKAKKIIPCSLQLLIENAFKHNQVRKNNPLKIEIRITEDSVVVRNNLLPKFEPEGASTQMGLKYINRQYENLFGKSIQINRDDQTYEVILPLLKS